MQEILDQIITPEVRMVIYLMVICVVMLYILSIIYVIRDAQRRGAEPWWMWAVISVVPVVGLLAYVILRPSSYLIDREEQDLDIALREHQLSHYGICPNVLRLQSTAILSCAQSAIRRLETFAQHAIATERRLEGLSLLPYSHSITFGFVLYDGNLVFYNRDYVASAPKLPREQSRRRACFYE